MTKSIQNLLKKVSYLEAEIEIQKQILYSIPTSERVELEKVLKTIAKTKDEIKKLRLEMQSVDPAEFEKICRIEESVAVFQKMNTEKEFATIESMTNNEKCSLTCRDGRVIQCLVKACDKNGDWTIISTEGALIKLPASDV